MIKQYVFTLIIVKPNIQTRVIIGLFTIKHV